MTRIRKSSAQIRFEILEFLFYNRRPQLRTHLWRKATTLSYDDFLKHLDYLVERELVEKKGGSYSLTSNGMKVYMSLRDALPSIM
ncbi:MAG: winged helix-turn-helix domain-containing protein [Candidatus Geothermarchaeales archaeon]